LATSSQFLFLACGVRDHEGFWFVGVRNSDENILDDKNLLDCHRKELIGVESAKDILFAIDLNLNNLFDKKEKYKFQSEKASLSISLDFPLYILENIFDFWLETYKNTYKWELCLGLLKMRKRISLSNLIKSGGLKGNSKKWALEVERLHNLKTNSVKTIHSDKPMWE